jgi:2-oxoacid:acceptor oxidoreductase delta subunit (pyruvate/2-ketoisovalerate family)
LSDWRNICKDKNERPKVQVYKSWKDLPPIPISFPDAAGPTGDWRSFRPILIKEKCTKCGFCWMYCPEGTISQSKDGYFTVDYRFCKGCGICAHECPKGAMVMLIEKEAQKNNEKTNEVKEGSK